jgi:16S rRNA (cytosine967-C5)-methyltransferase
LAGGAVHELDGFEDGAWWVQDAAAALPVRLLGDVAGKRVLDLCAAPGGKTVQLAAAGAEVTAIDRSARRLRRVRENLNRLGLEATIQDADAIEWRPEELADAVLLDAPCSATGTIRRHPDVARLKRAQDVTDLAETQAALLRASAEMVKPGGLVVYCTCSLQAAEGEDQIAAALAAGLPFERVPVTAEEVGGLSEAITAKGELRTLPCHWSDRGGLDGFFAARLRRL